MMCAIKKAGVGEGDRCDDSAERSRAGGQGDQVNSAQRSEVSMTIPQRVLGRAEKVIKQ